LHKQRLVAHATYLQRRVTNEQKQSTFNNEVIGLHSQRYMADWVTRYVLSNDAPAVTLYCPRVTAGPTDRLLGI